jgi:hypothetical protein
VYNVTVAVTITERADQLRQNNAPAHFTALVLTFFSAKHHITQVWKPPYNTNLAPCDLWLFPRQKSPLKESDL